MSKVLKKKSHWTNKVHETVLCRNKDGELNVEIRGGAENGQFSFLGEIKQNRVMYQGGRLHADELLLEVNDTPVSGLTIRDVLAVIRHCKDPIRLKCVKQGTVIDQKPLFSFHHHNSVCSNLYFKHSCHDFIIPGTQ
uniref:PDZ domain-containing protein n=1 Tax=Callorhinchus milii TaxID=7868 RepID=A0A4W3JTL5_CALMI